MVFPPKVSGRGLIPKAIIAARFACKFYITIRVNNLSCHLRLFHLRADMNASLCLGVFVVENKRLPEQLRHDCDFGVR